MTCQTCIDRAIIAEASDPTIIIPAFAQALHRDHKVVGVTVATDNRGDLVAHVAGCRDLTNASHIRQNRNEPGNTFEADTMAEAILKMDRDWADAFGEPYPVTAEHRGEVWSIGWGSIQSAPCLVTATKGMTWTENREPVIPKGTLERAPDVAGPHQLEAEGYTLVPAKPKRTVVVRTIVMTEVDVDAYEAEYGSKATMAEVRAHVKGEVVSAAESAFANIEAIKVTDWS